MGAFLAAVLWVVFLLPHSSRASCVLDLSESIFWLLIFVSPMTPPVWGRAMLGFSRLSERLAQVVWISPYRPLYHLFALQEIGGPV